MHLLAVLLAIASMAGPDPLAPALEAFAHEDYAAAERLALARARPPREGAALYLAGLARFRAGRPGDALDALDRAARAGDPPAVGVWQYNRGACLQDLGRLAEAEAAFAAAAFADPTLAPVALVNAARAALEAGAPARAADHARRARAVATGGAVALVAELEAELAGGGAEGPEVGGRRGEEARPGPRGLAARAAREGSLRVGGAYDGNVLQSGLQSTREVAPAPGEGTASLAATAGVAVARRWRLGEGVAWEVAYGADQVAYATSVVRDYSLQQHALAASVEAAPGERWRLGVSVRGAVAFTGLEDFRVLQGAGALGGWVALDEGRGAVTRLDAEWTRKVAPRDAFAYLAGDRVDLALSQTVNAGPLELGAVYRFRVEAIGTVTETLAPGAEYELPRGACPMMGPCGAQTYVIPLGYDSHAGGATARLPLGDRVALGASAGLEWLRYRGESYLSVVPPPDPFHPESAPSPLRLDPVRREDRRVYGALWASVRASRRLDLTLRWDGVQNRSNVARPAQAVAPGAAHALDYDDKNYVKHVVGLDATWRW